MGACQYDLRLDTVEELADIEEMHSGIVGPNPMYTDGALRISRLVQPPGLRLTGDIDASNVTAVADALAKAMQGEGDVHLDLSGLTFCDVGGMRAIVSAAERLGGTRRLVLRGLPSHLQHVIRVIGWDELPGLTIVARDAATPAS